MAHKKVSYFNVMDAVDFTDKRLIYFICFYAYDKQRVCQYSERYSLAGSTVIQEIKAKFEYALVYARDKSMNNNG